MFHKVVVANRGAVAVRVLRALRSLLIRSVAVYSVADRGACYLAEADETYEIGAGPARDSYLNQEVLLEVIRQSRADGLHPGYGFLAESPSFAVRVQETGATFIGPSHSWIRILGHKVQARELIASCGLPVGRGSGALSEIPEAVLAAAREIGYPVLVKPAAGGGGIGMISVTAETQILGAVERARSLAAKSFSDPEVYLEKQIERPRHVEFQVLGDRHGALRHLFERDCTVQRRHQKVIEEAPAPRLARSKVDQQADAVAGALGKMGYDNLGTVEMLLSPEGEFSFLEMNTRLQVEHGVTEEITGIDLVVAQIRSAAGEHLDSILPEALMIKGHAIQARIYAEDPIRFLPSPGRLTVFRPPHHSRIRIETGYAEGQEVTPYYDPLLAKMISWGTDRSQALDLLLEGLEEFAIQGVKNNIPALLRVLRSESFRAGEFNTGLMAQVLS